MTENNSNNIETILINLSKQIIDSEKDIQKINDHFNKKQFYETDSKKKEIPKSDYIQNSEYFLG